MNINSLHQLFCFFLLYFHNRSIILSENEKGAKSNTEKVNLDADKLWKAGNTAPKSGPSSGVDDLGKLGTHPTVPATSVLQVTENLKKTALETEDPLALTPIQDWNEVEMC